MKALSYGDYREQHLTTEQFVFSRACAGSYAVVAVNNADHPCTVYCAAPDGVYRGARWGREAIAKDGGFSCDLAAHGGEVWVSVEDGASLPVAEDVPVMAEITPVVEEVAPVAEEILPEVVEAPIVEEKAAVEEVPAEAPALDLTKPYEDMTVAELQAVILGKMAKNGPVTDYMRKTVDDNTHHGSLVTWARSF